MFGCCELGDGLGLDAEARALVRAGVAAGEDHLEGDEAVELRLPGLVDDAHAAAAQLALNLETGDFGPARLALGLRQSGLAIGRR